MQLLLLRFRVNCVFATEAAVLVHLKLIRGILLVFYRVIVSLLALVAPECDFYAHYGTSNVCLPALY